MTVQKTIENTAGLFPACLTEFEAAKYINMSVSFLRHHRQHGFLDGKAHGPRYVKLGKSIRYRTNDLNNWLADNLCPNHESSKNIHSFKF